MKNPLEITQDVLNGMIGIGGVPTNQEFYDEFNDRLKAALSLHNVVGQSEQCEKPNFYPVGKSQTDYYCSKCGKHPNKH